MLAMFWFEFKITILTIEPCTQFKSKKIKNLYISQQALQLYSTTAVWLQNIINLS